MKAALLLLLVCLLTTGCFLREAQRNLDTLAMLTELRGTVTGALPEGASTYVLVYRRGAAGWEIMSHRVLHGRASADVEFLCRPGKHLVFAFADLDGDRTWDGDEPAAKSSVLELGAGQPAPRVDLVLGARTDPPGFAVTVNESPEIAEELVRIRRGDLARLDEPRFAPEAGDLGFWQPADFALKYGVGVSFLSPYDPNRTPVLFIHGAKGTPRDFTRLVAGLDPRRHQAWVYSYPSGIRLDLASATLARITADLRQKLGFTELVVVAHSMGGLVARAYVNQVYRTEPAPYVTRLVTLSAPFGGSEASEMGVKRSPIVLPCWRDLVPNSPFLTSLFATPLPPTMHHHLLFSYEGGGSDAEHTDGAVTLKSQLTPEAQAKVTRVRGFPLDHEQILMDDRVVADVRRALEE